MTPLPTKLFTLLTRVGGIVVIGYAIAVARHTLGHG